jgi:hypothetical protein
MCDHRAGWYSGHCPGVYRVFDLKRSQTIKYEPRHAQNDETNVSIEFL